MNEKRKTANFSSVPADLLVWYTWQMNLQCLHKSRNWNNESLGVSGCPSDLILKQMKRKLKRKLNEKRYDGEIQFSFSLRAIKWPRSDYTIHTEHSNLISIAFQWDHEKKDVDKLCYQRFHYKWHTTVSTSSLALSFHYKFQSIVYAISFTLSKSTISCTSSIFTVTIGNVIWFRGTHFLFL